MDLRIQKTYRSLLAAFTRLLETHRYEEVTVAMLCDEAMIRRTTFYKHFSDKAAFFAFFMDSMREKLASYGEQVPADKAGEANLEALTRFMLDHERLVDNIFESAVSGMMLRMLEERVAETIRKRHEAQFAGQGDAELKLAVASEFAAGGIVRMLERWWAREHAREEEPAFIALAEGMVSRIFAA